MRTSVGIVLVSHSPLLAAGVRELVEQLGGGSVRVAVAGGTEDGELGTSYELITEAVRQADGGAGVVVLPDLGSSVLTARAVLADLGRAEELVLVDAPFVEGAVSAVVTASTGAGLAEVVRAAQEAWQAHKF
ncbi:PTS hybrid protein [Kitasatospora sp. GAS204A]|uniref:dihydroxyacetone kinase phosphoryl donor subunit DhaM n=1 Tax=unclassified Kitasatospora TaxID=2633591 RepID=UPI0024748632|nr:dihydroxyacetone kinase phosphoryl donor subunit DhaM [Kitasatospora sp. GAS204B]MDH6117098.1 PTS hybrid protein [Kitasatospora sp. GAS204B]